MRVVVVCPGRGTYTKSELRSLSGGRPDPRGVRAELLSRADRERTQRGRLSLSELDRSERFSALHLRGENAAGLIYTGSSQDALSLRDDIEVVAVCGNSMGWYTALFAAGVVGFEDGLTIVDTMGGLGRPGEQGGQLIVPICDDAWRVDEETVRAVDATIRAARAAGHRAEWSIRLGGYAVLAGDEGGVRYLLSALPKSRSGDREYPFQLLGHAAFHTDLMTPVSQEGWSRLGSIPFASPAVPLIDGRGFVFRQKTATERALREYTFGHQVVATYDLTRSVRVAMREFAPDALVLLGPGDSLGGALGQILVAEGWNRVRSKADFIARQKSERPLLISMGRAEQYPMVGRGAS